MTQRRPRRPLDVYPTVTLARSITDTVRRHRPRPSLDWFGGAGFWFGIDSADDFELGRKMMEFDTINQGSKTQQCRLPCVHLTVDWPSLRPTRKEMEEAARSALQVLGMGNALALFVGRNGWQKSDARPKHAFLRSNRSIIVGGPPQSARSSRLFSKRKLVSKISTNG